MKRILPALLVLLCATQGFSNNFYFAWNGYGVSTRNNYNLGHCYGAYYYHGVGDGVGLGTQEFYQNITMFYNRERNAGTGSSLQSDVTYRFFSPMVVLATDKRRGQTQMYMTAGVGELQSSSTVTLNKWSRVPWTTGTMERQEIDLSTGLNKYVARLGLGFVQMLKLGGNFHLFVNEDYGFIVSNMTNLQAPELQGVKTNLAHFFQPSYFSLRVGICFIPKSKFLENPYKIFRGHYVWHKAN